MERKPLLLRLFFFQSDVPLDKLSESSNDHPYIIAVGDTIDDITHYYIELEKHLMPVCKYQKYIMTW